MPSRRSILFNGGMAQPCESLHLMETFTSRNGILVVQSGHEEDEG
jgi:hypothetical protein